MIEARKRFVLFAMLCVFLLLSLLLGIINGVSFRMASEDADRLTQMLAQQRGVFAGPMPPALPPDMEQPETESSDREPPRAMLPVGEPRGGFFPEMMGPMGPESPEMEASLRYFTFAFAPDGSAKRVAWQISAVSEEDALSWARSLLKEKETGWTDGSYRYRVYVINGETYVTVIDQGRELLPTFRILMISGIGLAAGVAVSCLALMLVGKKLFQPLEEADRKQKHFIAQAEKEFKVPLTIINANTEILERENGETEQTLSINRQVKKMIGLVKQLSHMGMFDEKELTALRFDVSALARAAGDAMKEQFEEKGIALRVIAEQPVEITGDSEAMNDLLTELLNNALKFSAFNAELKLGQQDGHNVIITSNDTTLPDGNLDQVFDRFTRLDNAAGIPGFGLGLSHVKEIVQAHNGRANAKAEDGSFILRINL